MLKYVDVKEVFSEIPDEITLAISISGCPFRCKGCHSQYLWEDKGENLTTKRLKDMIIQHKGITCVCFMGGDSQPWEIDKLAFTVKHNFPNIKVAWYSGQDKIDEEVNWKFLDYIKIGHYDKEKGPLTSKTTNQVMLQINHFKWGNTTFDITNKFWKNESNN